LKTSRVSGPYERGDCCLKPKKNDQEKSGLKPPQPILFGSKRSGTQGKNIS